MARFHKYKAQNPFPLQKQTKNNNNKTSNAYLEQGPQQKMWHHNNTVHRCALDSCFPKLPVDEEISVFPWALWLTLCKPPFFLCLQLIWQFICRPQVGSQWAMTNCGHQKWLQGVAVQFLHLWTTDRPVYTQTQIRVHFKKKSHIFCCCWEMLIFHHIFSILLCSWWK